MFGLMYETIPGTPISLATLDKRRWVVEGNTDAMDSLTQSLNTAPTVQSALGVAVSNQLVSCAFDETYIFEPTLRQWSEHDTVVSREDAIACSPRCRVWSMMLSANVSSRS